MFQDTSVGLDVHARSVTAHGINTRTGEVFNRHFGNGHSVEEIVGWVVGLPGPVQACYEAGPTGFGLARAFADAGVACLVAAPSKLLPAPGDRVKTDARDAAHLATLLAAGAVTPVRVPDVGQEALRDLLRAREGVREDLMRVRHRVSKLLLRHGRVYDGKTTWNQTHLDWLAHQTFDQAGTQIGFDDCLAAVTQAMARQKHLDQRLEVILPDSGYQNVVAALSCLRGVSTLSGFGLAVEIGDWTRFTGATIGAYLGLVPSEHSSGQSRSLGGITKTGNQHARRLLIEAAWHHRAEYRPGASLRLRKQWEQVDPLVQTRADQANRRLYRQWVKFDVRKKRPVIANAAIARELAGFCWSLAMMTTN